MQNLWQRLKPAVKTKILANKEQYPYLVKDTKQHLENNKFWTDLPIQAARQVVNFSHDSVFEITMNDFMWGDLFIKKA